MTKGSRKKNIFSKNRASVQKLGEEKRRKKKICDLPREAAKKVLLLIAGTLRDYPLPLGL